MITDATISPCGHYRYDLWRLWDESKPLVLFVLCNPSTADVTKNDPTVWKCIQFGHRFGAGGIGIVNVCAYRSPNPVLLRQVSDPLGPDNRTAIDAALKRCMGGPVIVGWGNALPKHLRQHGAELARHIEDKNRLLLCFGLTQQAQPKHPLMISYETSLEPFKVYRPFETEVTEPQPDFSNNNKVTTAAGMRAGLAAARERMRELATHDEPLDIRPTPLIPLPPHIADLLDERDNDE